MFGDVLKGSIQKKLQVALVEQNEGRSYRLPWPNKMREHSTRTSGVKIGPVLGFFFVFLLMSVFYCEIIAHVPLRQTALCKAFVFSCEIAVYVPLG